jgi:hypothetical protein
MHCRYELIPQRRPKNSRSMANEPAQAIPGIAELDHRVPLGLR